jgi:hypothetical protein
LPSYGLLFGRRTGQTHRGRNYFKWKAFPGAVACGNLPGVCRFLSARGPRGFAAHAPPATHSGLDTPELYELPEFKGKVHGTGETAWVRDGKIVATSGLGLNTACFKPNTLALISSLKPTIRTACPDRDRLLQRSNDANSGIEDINDLAQ